MTYSANSYESPFYGVGFATAKNIFGPWKKYERNPILQKPGDLIGVGHSALFKDKSGQLRIVFHSHNSKTKIHPRTMHIGTVYFDNENGKEIMKIGDDIITPTLLKE
jgi:beta-xylosidase